MSHYRTFGTLAYIFIDKSLRTKFQSKGTQVIFIGYSATSKGWRFWNPLTDKVTESSDVIFDEATGYSSSPFTSKRSSSVPIPTHLPVSTMTPQIHTVPISSLTPPSDSVGASVSTDSIPPLDDETSDTSLSQDHTADQSLEQITEDIDPIPDIVDLPSSSQSVPPNSFEEPENPKFRSLKDVYSASSQIESVPPNSSISYANMIHAAENYREPATYKQATMSPQAAYWKAAMEKEYDSLMENHTWTLVPPPPGRNIIQCKWVYRIKYTSTGTIDKYKAHLVAKGYSQVHGIDYTETFSPVIKHDSVRVLFAIAAVLRMHMRQFDIGTAYLNSDLTTKIYMQQPEGFIHPKHPSHVCALLKSLYGLKQSGRLWNHTFDAFLKLYDLIASDADTCVYYRLNTGNTVDLIVGIFVDDGIVCASNTHDLNAVIEHLQGMFKVTHGPMDYYVGFQVHQNPITHTIHVNQTRYISDIIKRFNLEQANTVSIPADTHMPLQESLGEDDLTLSSSIPYREAVGCLMYAMVLTRPDIAFAVSRVAKFTTKPRNSHWTTVKRIYRYLSGTITMGISYFGHSTDLTLRGYCDADYAGDHDDRKSRPGYLFLLANGAVAWCSKRQTCTADSTTEAEFVAMAESVKEAIWLRRLLQSLGFPSQVPTPIFSDNQGAIQLVKNPKFHKRTKHIETKYYLIREKYDRKEIDVFYIHTKQQLADLLTKALARESFQHLRSLQGLVAYLPLTSGRVNTDVIAE